MPVDCAPIATLPRDFATLVRGREAVIEIGPTASGDAPNAIPARRLIRQSGPHPHALGPYAEPIASVRPGETVVVHTADCFGGRLTREDQLPSEVLTEHLNPVTGPIWIDGAEPGDTLVVHVVEIQAARDWAVSCLLPYCGGLAPTHETPSLAPQLAERVWIYRCTSTGGFTWRDRWEVPWAPFFGTIGTAPALEVVSSASPGPHGGNMDVPDVTVGHTLYLPVRVPGARFFVGDAHAAQGQGELAGPALEIEAYGTFRFDLIKHRPLAWPRIETPDAVKAVGSARPMEDAARIAYRELVAWLETDFDYDPLDAYQLLTQVGGLYVANMVNSSYSLVASCPKRYLTPRLQPLH